MKRILDMSNDDAKLFLLKNKSYFSLDLPPYFDFNNLLLSIDNNLNGKDLKNFYKDNKTIPPKSCENVNYKFLHNKDGKFDWRPFEIIHPALYVYLVNVICEKDNWKKINERFKSFQKNKKIVCCSIPYESSNKKMDKKDTILNWWNTFEQKSISMSLKFNCMAITDITNCYGSIYTHSIAWAVETKNIAKKDHSDTLLGNKIDKIIQDMSYGQTNGIPQGSVLTDFIAEIVLGYADEQISSEINKNKIKDYSILRYRDDYRIFAQNEYDLNVILKIITEVLSELNFKLHTQKTSITDDIITNSIKKDKANILVNNYIVLNNIQKSLFNIRNFSLIYPNSGSLLKLLTEVYEQQIKPLKKKPKNVEQIISILVDIMYRNPKTYNLCVLILSVIFSFLGKTTIKKYINLISKKFKNLPNTNYIDIWLQRLTIANNIDRKYSCTLCKKIYSEVKIWNSDWLNLKIDESLIINNEIIQSISPIMQEEEVNPFIYQ
ncbi:MAG: RNA-directed DNA polymerase [Clostridium sp.]|nr:RNA-directed DNA polymerase [Clostridium sp.]